MLPVITPEQCTHPFNFYLNQEVRRGIRFENKLYGLVSEFDLQNSTKAYFLACRLMESGVPVLITAGPQHLAVWMVLQSSVSPHWEFQAGKITCCNCELLQQGCARLFCTTSMAAWAEPNEEVSRGDRP